MDTTPEIPDDNPTGKIIITGTTADADDYHTIPGSRSMFQTMCERVSEGHGLHFDAGNCTYFIPAGKVTELAFFTAPTKRER